MENASMDERHRSLPLPREVMADSPALEVQPPTTVNGKQLTQTSPKQWGHALSQVGVYLDRFISTCQGGPT